MTEQPPTPGRTAHPTPAATDAALRASVRAPAEEAGRVPSDSSVDRDAVRDALRSAEQARTSVVDATLRPWWFDLIQSAVLGFAMGTGVYALDRDPALWLLAIAGLVIGIGMEVWTVRHRRRRGRVLDERAVGASYLRYFVAYLPMFVLMVTRPETPAPLWWAILTGVIVAAGGFALERWDQAYQAKRLARGDYGPYDLT